ncbi:MAG: 1-acyl-sn-glycerol-3-phosphate acyltransferase [Glaciecola sp.]|jgi:1-acyl-sn-glycerol-3-phosphate acyltransferase
MEPVYTPVIGSVLAGFRAMSWDLRFTGVEHIPATGGGVIATNHVGYLDFTFVGAAARQQNKRLLRFLAKQEIFDHRLGGPLMRGMKHIAVDRAGHAADSLRHAEQALRDGELIGMFPESTINLSFVPLKGKTGAARMALDTGTPLIPGAVWGSQRLWTKDRPRDLRRNVVITVDFGPPIDTSPGRDPGEVTAELMVAIESLVDRAQRNYPTKPEGGERWWLPAHLGGTAPTLQEAQEMAAKAAAERRARHEAKQ